MFELYWRDVEISRQTAERMHCLNKKELPPHNLINIKYETEFGRLEFWEEIKTVKLPGFDQPVELISPYMKIWIFPPKEFIAYEMKTSMETGEFPGPPEEKREREREEGPTEEEKELIRQDKKFMKTLRKAIEDYDGYLDVSIQLRDYEKEEVVFNLYVQINEEDIVKIKPMLPSQMPEVDVTAEIDFEDIYDLILAGEKDMRGEMTESPPWDRKARPVERVKQVVNGVRMWFKVRGIINSAKISPESSTKEIRSLGKTFIKMMMAGDERGPPEEEMEEKEGKEPESWEDVSELTGEVIRV
jgi:hypothetical protein